MKTFWFMIGGSAVLTAALVFVGMYRMSLPDSTGQPQNAPQVQKQHISESTPAKENSGRSVSELPKPASVARPSVAGVKPGAVMNNSGRLVAELPKLAPAARFSVAAFKPGAVMNSPGMERINKTQRRELTAVKPQGYPGNATGAMPEQPNWTMRRQSRARSTENNGMIQGPTSGPIFVSRLQAKGGDVMQFDSFVPADNAGISDGSGTLAEGSRSVSSVMIPRISQATQESSNTAKADNTQTFSDSQIQEARLSPELLKQPPFQRAASQRPTSLKAPDIQQTAKTRELLKQMPARYQGLLDIVDGKADPAVVLKAIREEQAKSSSAGPAQGVSNNSQSVSQGQALQGQAVTGH